MIRTLEKLRSAQRELAMRKNVYPKWVASGRMKQNQADHEIAAMTAIVDDYQIAYEKGLIEQPEAT